MLEKQPKSGASYLKVIKKPDNLFQSTRETRNFWDDNNITDNINSGSRINDQKIQPSNNFFRLYTLPSENMNNSKHPGLSDLDYLNNISVVTPEYMSTNANILTPDDTIKNPLDETYQKFSTSREEITSTMNDNTNIWKPYIVDHGSILFVI